MTDKLSYPSLAAGHAERQQLIEKLRERVVELRDKRTSEDVWSDLKPPPLECRECGADYPHTEATDCPLALIDDLFAALLTDQPERPGALVWVERDELRDLPDESVRLVEKARAAMRCCCHHQATAMSHAETPQTRESLTLDQVKEVRESVYRHSKTGGRSWRMSIPPQAGDSDSEILALCDSHERLRSELTACRLNILELIKERNTERAAVVWLTEAVEVRDSVLRQHANAAVCFQPGGDLYKRADLPIGSSTVVAGIAWLRRELEAAEARLAPQSSSAPPVATEPGR